MEAFKKIYPSEFYKKFLTQRVRPDGRGLNGVRKTVVSVGAIDTADGSAFVRVGSTSMLCGIRAEIGPRRTHKVSPIAVNVELLPLASAAFPRGKPGETAQVLGDLLNSLAATLVAREALDVDVGAEALSWYLCADIYCLDFNGNALDPALLALIAALRHLRLRGVKEENGELVEDTSVAPTRLTLTHAPVALTFSVIDDYVIADPSIDEEKLQAGSLTAIYDEKGALVTLLKPGGVALRDEVLQECMVKAKGRVPSILKKIDKALARADEPAHS